MKKVVTGTAKEVSMLFKDTLNVTTPSKEAALWANPIFRTMFEEFLISGAFQTFGADDETLGPHLSGFESEARRFLNL